MKVIVFTMAYNADKTLSRAMDSVLNQTFPNLEYFVLDNGSTDRTWEIIQEYATRDQRVFPLNIAKNDPAHGILFLRALAYATDGDYFVWLDADDSYSPDFLEKMIPFARENHLDIASCGFDSIDGQTGRLLKHRSPPENIILHGKEFADRFPDYRSFTMALWGKVYSVSFLKELRRKKYYKRSYFMYADAMDVQEMFQEAECAGIYAESLHQYYQYPQSTSHINLRENIVQYRRYILSARRYLEHYGSISKLNMDFLYAIYLSLADESVEHIFSSMLPAVEKLELLRLTFAEPLWSETLARDADPQFRNLAARKEYVAQMKERILALPSTLEEQERAEQAIRELDKPIAGVLA